MNKVVSFLQPNFQQGPTEYNAFYLPYTAGVILAYALKHNPDWQVGEIVWRRDPVEQVAQRLAKSQVVGFSTYVWNHQYNYAVAQRVKEINPDCLIVMGGPEVAVTDPNIFKQHPWMGIVIKKEGELIFSQVLKQNGKDLDNIAGLLINENNKVKDTGDAERIDDLDSLPSPYLTGLFDDLIKNNPSVIWNATLETNRGCPYQCTFCDWGSLTYNKIKKFSLDRVFAELDWIGQHCGHVSFTDANMGMFVQRDNIIIDKLIEVHKKHPNLKNAMITWAKNQKNEVVDMIKKLSAVSDGLSRGLTVSVQSLDTNVLDIIKRKNLEQHKIKEIFDICHKHNLPVYTEMILGLPGETPESWKQNIWSMFESGNHSGVTIVQAQMLENAEMNLLQRRLYQMETVKIHDYLSGTNHYDDINESIEVVVSTKSLPRTAMLDIMVWNTFIQTFHIKGLSTYIARYLNKAYQVSYQDFYDKLYQWVQQDPWWQRELDLSRANYEEWFTNGKIHNDHSDVIKYRGWNSNLRNIINVHAQKQIPAVLDLLSNFMQTHFDIPELEEIIRFQKYSILDFDNLSNYPIQQSFKLDFYNYLVYNTELHTPVTYEFYHKENSKMSQTLFLENFWWERNRKFGITSVRSLFASADTPVHNDLELQI